MHEHDDLLVALARANPVATAAIDRRALPAADDLFERVVTGGRPRRDRRVLVAVAIIIAIALGLLAFGLVRRESPEKSLGGVVCHPSLDLTGSRFVSFEAGGAVDVCADAWERGLVGEGPVPNLSACILDTGVIGVFPGEAGTTCARLGLPVALERDADLVNFGRDLGTTLNEECIGADEAIAVVEAKFEEWGMDGWVVSLGAGPPFDAEYPCASAAVDVDGREVSLIAIGFDPNR
ncbi:MAG: hypothetical protein SGJ13_06065 [Actinomycetota bacterium]|nr:hypothetical protein [Actinomycetota bacterium]